MSTAKQQVEAVLRGMPDESSLEQIRDEIDLCTGLSAKPQELAAPSEEEQEIERVKRALEADLEWAALIARIQSLPPNPENIRPAQGSLEEYLAASIASENPNEEFDLKEWQRNWDAVEAEMKAVTKANDIAEGRM